MLAWGYDGILPGLPGLRHYIAERMRMSHIYQPLMLMELQGRSSPAPAQDIARRILGEDVTQVEYYTERVKRMVGRVLTGNGITSYGDGLYTLIGAEELSDSVSGVNQVERRIASLKLLLD